MNCSIFSKYTTVIPCNLFPTFVSIVHVSIKPCALLGHTCTIRIIIFTLHIRASKLTFESKEALVILYSGNNDPGNLICTGCRINTRASIDSNCLSLSRGKAEGQKQQTGEDVSLNASCKTCCCVSHCFFQKCLQ